MGTGGWVCASNVLEWLWEFRKGGGGDEMRC